MSHRFAPLVGALAALVLNSGTAAELPRVSEACDRSCLRQVLDAYMAAVFKHDPGAAPLTGNHVATENTTEIHNGEGFWKTVSGYGEIQNRYLDPANESAAFFGLVHDNGKDQLVSVRIRLEGRKISEAEWIVAGPPQGGNSGALASDPEVLIKHPPPTSAAPAAERSSRFMLISIANDYFQAVQDHDGSWIPSDPRCAQKNGPIASLPRHADICHDNFGIFKGVTKDLALRRFPVVDEQAGVILGVAVFQRYPGVPRQDNLVHEYFLIRKDLIEDIWTSMYYLPKGSPVTTGWENR